MNNMNLLLDAQPKNRLLKKTAVPSVNLATDTPITLKKKQNNFIRIQRAENRAKKRKLHIEEEKRGKKKVEIRKVSLKLSTMAWKMILILVNVYKWKII